MHMYLGHRQCTFFKCPMTANVFQIAGIAAVALGAGLVFIPAGVIVAGLGLVLFGVAMERE